MGLLYLYATWSDRRKKRKAALSKSAEESERLTGGPGAISDCENGAAKTSRKGNETSNVDGRGLARPLDVGFRRVSLNTHPTYSQRPYYGSDEASISGTTFAPDLPSYDRPPSPTRTNGHLETFGTGQARP